jgi:hypothetical protein
MSEHHELVHAPEAAPSSALENTVEKKKSPETPKEWKEWMEGDLQNLIAEEAYRVTREVFEKNKEERIGASLKAIDTCVGALYEDDSVRAKLMDFREKLQSLLVLDENDEQSPNPFEVVGSIRKELDDLRVSILSNELYTAIRLDFREVTNKIIDLDEKRELTGLQLRKFIGGISRVDELETLLVQGKFCYGGKRKIHAVHEAHFDEMNDNVEVRGFSYGYHGLMNYDELSPDSMEGNGDFSLAYKSEDGRETLVVDTDGHGASADTVSRLMTIYFELSRRFFSEDSDIVGLQDVIEQESAILNKAINAADRFMAGLSIVEDRKETAFVFLKTQYDREQKNKDIWAGMAGDAGCMWIVQEDQGGFSLHVPPRSGSIRTASLSHPDTLKLVDLPDDAVIPLLGMPFNKSEETNRTMLQDDLRKRKRDPYPEKFRLEKIGTVPRGTWVMAFSDGLMECERFDVSSGKWIPFEKELPEFWESFLEKVNPQGTLSLGEVQALWAGEMKQMAQKAVALHDEKRSFLVEYIAKHPEEKTTAETLNLAWQKQIKEIFVGGSEDQKNMYATYDAADDITFIVV